MRDHFISQIREDLVRKLLADKVQKDPKNEFPDIVARWVNKALMNDSQACEIHYELRNDSEQVSKRSEVRTESENDALLM